MSYIGDGLPDSGRYEMVNGQVHTGPGDASMHVIFYKRPVHNAINSGAAGRPVYDDRDFVKIQHPGERLNIVEREVTELDKRRWPAQWQAYASGKNQVAQGTPLGLLFPRHPATVANLNAIGFLTVEQLSNASATAIESIGMHGQDYVNYAQKYLKAATGGIAFHQMQAEVEEQKKINKRLQKQLDEMTNQMQAMSAAFTANQMPQMGVMAGGPRPEGQIVPSPQMAQPVQMAPVPSFGNSPLVADTQTAMINANHESKPGRGWPKGKKRGPKNSADEAA